MKRGSLNCDHNKWVRYEMSNTVIRKNNKGYFYDVQLLYFLIFFFFFNRDMVLIENYIRAENHNGVDLTERNLYVVQSL